MTYLLLVDCIFIHAETELGNAQVSNLSDNRSSYSNSQIPKYEKFEITFDIDWYKNHQYPADSNNPTAEESLNQYDPITEGILDGEGNPDSSNLLNPYWPYDENPAANTETHPNAVPDRVGISVDGLFTNNDWVTTTVQPGFYYQDYNYELKDNKDWLYPEGKLVWKIRFTPTLESENWQYKIRIADASGTTYSESTGFTVTSADESNHGFVQVSERDPSYFEMSDQTQKNFAGVNDYSPTVKDMSEKFPAYAANNVNLIRPWWQGSQGPVLFGISGQGGAPDWDYMLSETQLGLGTEQAMPGDLFSVKAHPENPTARITADVKTNTEYTVNAWVKTSAVTGTDTYGANIYVSSSTNPLYRSDYFTGDTDWQEITLDFTTNATSSKYYIYLNLAGTGVQGEAYFSKLSLREKLSVDEIGPEILNHPDMNVQKYISQQNGWKADYMTELAKENGIYMKVVVEEKADWIYERIAEDGTAGAQSEYNVYGSATHASRTYQTYYWRYLIARYGYATNIHSLELFNEGELQGGTPHFDIANAFGNYFQANDPNHMTTTSFFHSIPVDFWRTSSLSYIDFHEYIGPDSPVANHGNRIYSWMDRLDSALPYDNGKGALDLDLVEYHDGQKSLKLNPAHTEDPVNHYQYEPDYEYHVGINPAHTYTVRYKAKAENITNVGGSSAGLKPSIHVHWSAMYHENDSIGSTNAFAPMDVNTVTRVPGGPNTYDWTLVEKTGISPPVNANTANIAPYVPRPLVDAPDSYFWVDDVEFIDETTGQNLFVDGGFEGERIDYDIALAVQKYGILLDSYSKRLQKPAMWAETGIRGFNRFGSPYKDQTYVNEHQQLIDDSDGTYVRKMVWAQLGQYKPNLLYWWAANIFENGLFKYYKTYQDFISNLDLSNSLYQDIGATVDNENLRVFGQKEMTDGKASKAHLWLDNKPFTWKAVANSNFNIEDAAHAYGSAKQYKLNSIATANGGANIYKCIKVAYNGYIQNHPLSEDEYWDEIDLPGALALLDMSSYQPSLPAPVSGTVTIPDMENGWYEIQWWDTSAGEIVNTETKEVTDDIITLNTPTVESDIAVKIYPTSAPTTPADPHDPVVGNTDVSSSPTGTNISVSILDNNDNSIQEIDPAILYQSEGSSTNQIENEVDNPIVSTTGAEEKEVGEPMNPKFNLTLVALYVSLAAAITFAGLWFGGRWLRV